jgi:hypothetical protein
MAEGIHRMLQSGYWINTVFPAFKNKYPIDAGKIENEQKGVKKPLPASDFAKGIVEEIRRHPLSPPPSTNFSIYEEPVVFLHSARGGVEYQEEQTKYFGVAACDLNGVKPDDPLTKWDTYKARAKLNSLETVDWQHCHTYAEIQNLLNLFATHPKKTGILNLESIVSEGISPNIVAEMIDTTLGRDVILGIITLGWMDGIDWSALSRHVFQLEFFLNDPPPNGDWQGISDVELCRQLAYHAREDCGVRKLTMVCGVYDASQYNQYARTITSAEYKNAIRTAGERFGGIYLGDTNGSNYSQWAW